MIQDLRKMVRGQIINYKGISINYIAQIRRKRFGIIPILSLNPISAMFGLR